MEEKTESILLRDENLVGNVATISWDVASARARQAGTGYQPAL